MERRSSAAVATAVVAAFVLFASACSDDEPTQLPDPLETGTPVEVPASTTPTVDPEAETGFAAGTASITLTGAVNLSETYPTLGLPALWVPPPGDFAMTWVGSGQRTLTLGGVSFTAQQPTSPERVLAFTVGSGDGQLAFTSSAGECLVTISPALPDHMGGTFLCTSIAGDAGDGTAVTVTAQGTFTAE
jgi:hypothetical protein